MIDADGIATCHLGHAWPLDERADRKLYRGDLTAIIERIMPEDDAIKGAVITSRQEGVLSAGADLAMMNAP